MTNAQFRKFIKADGYNTQRWWTETGWKQITRARWTESLYHEESDFSDDNQPVVDITWYEGIAFCLWLSEITGENIMLPTDAQWQYAARGNHNRNFPWGNEWDCERCNNSVNPCESTLTTPVTQYEGKGDSPFGAVDMAGNVWEWCLTDFDNIRDSVDNPITTSRRIVRGGSWDSNYAHWFHCGHRALAYPGQRWNSSGFRIVRLN